MNERASDRTRIAAVTGLTAGVTLAGVIALFVAVMIVSVTATPLALSDGFFWGSAAAVVVMHLLCGTIAGRLAAPRLSRAGVMGGRRSQLLAAAGPAAVALLTNLRPVDGIPPIPGMLVPVTAAAAGAALGVRLSARRRRNEALVRY